MIKRKKIKIFLDKTGFLCYTFVEIKGGGRMDIKAFRKKYNLSREDLASKVGVSYMTIWRWEKGLINKPHKVIKEKLERIMRGYETSSKVD